MVNEYPLEKAENWAKKYEQGLSHTLAQQRKAIPNQKAFFEKVARPILDGSKYWISPEFNGVVSRKGRTGEDIYARMKDRLLDRKTARKYFRNTKMAYQTRDGVDAKRIKDWLPYAAAYYAMEMTFGAWRYLGPLPEEYPAVRRDLRGSNAPEFTLSVTNVSLTASKIGEGAFVLAGEWLTGRMDCLNFFRDKDERLQGHPIMITAPERASEFRQALRNKLARAVAIIDIFNYAPDKVREQNDKINEFINGFIRSEIQPFRAEGDSCVNLVVLPKTARLRRGRELSEMRYRICRHFLDETVARRQLILPEYVNNIIPSFVHTLIGHQDYSLCVDMRLDVKVAMRNTHP